MHGCRVGHCDLTPPTTPPPNPPPLVPLPAAAQVIKHVADKGELVNVALNTHGTRAVQKLIETLTSREQRALVIAALSPGVVPLIKDLNGNHVVQRCLQRLGPEDSQFIYDAAREHCVEVATHRHGCCVLQRCIDFATPSQKDALVDEVARHALVLSQVRRGCGRAGAALGSPDCRRTARAIEHRPALPVASPASHPPNPTQTQSKPTP
jgi:hypothetical protein